MKIVYAHNSSILKNSANMTQVLSMIKAFIRSGHKVVLFVPKEKLDINEVLSRIIKEFDMPEGFSLKYIPVIFTNRRAKKHLSFIFLKQCLKREKPELFITRDILFLFKAVRANYNSIYEIHNSRLHHGSFTINKLYEKTLIYLSKKNSLKLIVTISEKLKNFWIEKKLSEKKILDLHDGFDIELFKKALNKKECRIDLGLPLNDKLVTYTGNLYPNRGVTQILQFAQEIPECKFIIVGGPKKYENELQETARKQNLSNVIFTGQVDHSEINKYLFASDILLGIWTDKIPTMNYCSPLKVFEYMAAGRLIVAYGFPTIKEVLRDNHDALLADPGNTDDFKEKIVKALSLQNRSNIAENARKSAFSSYSWDSRAKKIFDALNLS